MDFFLQLSISASTSLTETVLSSKLLHQIIERIVAYIKHKIRKR